LATSQAGFCQVVLSAAWALKFGCVEKCH
jgi:hypothetical protein